MEYIKNLYEQTDKYQSLSPNEILTNLDKLDISSLCLKKEEIEKLPSSSIEKKIYTTIDKPFLIGTDFFNSGKTLYINPDYYLKNQEEVEKILSEIIKNNLTKKLDIQSQALITKKILEAVTSNKNLEEITLAMYDETKYILTKEDYNLLKQSKLKKVKTSGVSDELKNNFDSLIYYNYDRNLVGSNSYAALSSSSISLRNKITKEDLENLKYLPNSTTKIVIEEENMKDAVLISERLHELGKENHVMINVKNKEFVTNNILSNNHYLNENIDIQLGQSIVSVKEYLRFEKMLYQMIEGTQNLTPFERYISAYNVVKQYKQYKENQIDKSASRNLYAILENEYMVCVGYANMLEDLLNKSGIKNIHRNVGVDTSYDRFNENETVVSEHSSHAREYVYIKDPKYGIDGFYITDPTWDNDLKNDLYNHLLLTAEEETNSRRYNFINSSINNSSLELLNIKSLEEFYQKVNFYLDRNSKSTLKDILIDLVEHLKKLSPEFIETLKKQYPEMEKSFMNWSNEKEILYQIGEFLLTKVNKPVSGQTIMSAVSEVYQKAYHLEGEELQNKLKETIEINNQRQHIQFPKREKIDEYGSKIELPGISDKFNIDTSTYHK